MIKLNIMPVFLNRLRDRGWRNIPVRGYTDKNNQVLRLGEDSVVVIESIVVDPSADMMRQIDERFKTFIELIKRGRAKAIYLPGGGPVQIPPFFIHFCEEHGIQIHLITEENYMNFLGR